MASISTGLLRDRHSFRASAVALYMARASLPSTLMPCIPYPGARETTPSPRYCSEADVLRPRGNRRGGGVGGSRTVYGVVRDIDRWGVSLSAGTAKKVDHGLHRKLLGSVSTGAIVPGREADPGT